MELSLIVMPKPGMTPQQEKCDLPPLLFESSIKFTSRSVITDSSESDDMDKSCTMSVWVIKTLFSETTTLTKLHEEKQKKTHFRSQVHESKCDTSAEAPTTVP